MTKPQADTIPHRTELDVLRERKATLEQELQALRQRATHLEAFRQEEVAVAKELEAIEGRLGAGVRPRRALPLLEQVKVASPCPAEWNEMIGVEGTRGDRVRFCLSCEKNVYNLSAMSTDEAEALLVSTGDADLCVRFYRRADGTVLTEDCPVGQTRKRRKMAALAIAGAASLAATAFIALRGARHEEEACRLDRAHYVRDFQPQADTTNHVQLPNNPRPHGEMRAGGIRARPMPELGEKAPPPQPLHELKGQMMRMK